MAKIEYVSRDFKPATLKTIAMAEAICESYAAQGFTLTLRQLYYQFVSRDLIPNKQSEYDRLGAIINDARLAGLIDWSHLEDRTRNVKSVSHWETPEDVIRAAASSYRIDKWINQPYYVEVWIEKDALVGVIESVCRLNDVPYFSCRGYTSQSEMHGAAMRLIDRTTGYNEGVESVIIHLGDHDPSGIDMTRDIQDRLALFCEHHDAPVPTVERIALNRDQIDQYDPPPNPAKFTDSRAEKYVREHGLSSWELDALEPRVLVDLVNDTIASYRDEEQWDGAVAHEQEERMSLGLVAANWSKVLPFVQEMEG